MILGRWFSPRDRLLIDQFNAEIMGDVIQQIVVIYTISAEASNVNVYGESDQASGGITYNLGVECTALVERENFDTETSEFGPDRSQNLIFKFRERNLKVINVYPQLDDLLYFNARYYKIDNVVNDEQLLGGQPDKSHSIICHSHYTKLSSINLVNRQH